MGGAKRTKKEPAPEPQDGRRRSLLLLKLKHTWIASFHASPTKRDAQLAGRELIDARGPKGEKRPADVIGNAVHVMRIATGDAAETIQEKKPNAVALGKLGGKKGGAARAKNLSAKRRAIASKAANSRWNNRPN
jgi:hypothetical protein